MFTHAARRRENLVNFRRASRADIKQQLEKRTATQSAGDDFQTTFTLVKGYLSGVYSILARSCSSQTGHVPTDGAKFFVPEA